MYPFKHLKSAHSSMGKAFLLAAALFHPTMAFAASGGAAWAEPVANVFGDLEGGMVSIGTVAVGLGIVGYGIYSALFGDMRWQKMFQYVLGAVLIVVAPKAIRALVSLG